MRNHTALAIAGAAEAGGRPLAEPRRALASPPAPAAAPVRCRELEYPLPAPMIGRWGPAAARTAPAWVMAGFAKDAAPSGRWGAPAAAAAADVGDDVAMIAGARASTNEDEDDVDDDVPAEAVRMRETLDARCAPATPTLTPAPALALDTSPERPPTGVGGPAGATRSGGR